MTTRKTATDNGFIIFKDQLSLLNLIPNEIVGEAIKLLLANFDDLPKKENIAYELIATNIRRYREQAIKSSNYGKLGGNPTLKGRDKGTDNGIDKGTDKQQYNTKQKNNINNKTTIEQQNVDNSKKQNDVLERKYKFNGTIIKLNEKDYNVWKEKYRLLDLDYELEQMDLSLQTEKYKNNQKSWFFVVQGWLLKKQKEKQETGIKPYW